MPAHPQELTTLACSQNYNNLGKLS